MQRVSVWGVPLVIATALMISVQDVVFKLFGGDLTLWQIFALRGVIALPLLVCLGALSGHALSTLRAAAGLWPLARGVCLTMTFFAFYAAIPFLSLATVGAANYIAPIFVAVLSAYVIAEPVSRWGWAGVVLGFAGVIVLLQPGSDAFSPYAMLPIIGAAFYAVGHIITRVKCTQTPVAALALSLNLVMMLAGFTISAALLIAAPSAAVVGDQSYLLGPWAKVGLWEWAVLGVLALFAVVNGLMLARAYQITPPARAATFEYSYLVFAALWDIAIFDARPTAATLIGMAMIFAAGMLVTLPTRGGVTPSSGPKTL